MTKPVFSTEASYRYLAPEDRDRVRTIAMPPGRDDDRKLTRLGDGGRTWQTECYERLKDKRFAYFTAFMGSGKSVAMKYLASYDLVSSGGFQKQVVLVPLTSLHKGFRSGEVEIGGRRYWWNLGNDRDLCAEDSAQASGITDSLIQALTEPLDAYRGLWEKGDFYGRIIVTTDLAMAFAWARMTPEQRLVAAGNSDLFGVSYNKDEAHRVLMPNEVDEDPDEDAEDAETEDEKKGQVSNKMGEILSSCLQSKNGKIRLCTGTFTRGNREQTILGIAEDAFFSYEQDFVEHFKTLGINRFSMTSHVYKNERGVPELFGFLRGLASRFSKDGTKWMLMLPHRDKGWRREGNFAEDTRWGAKEVFKLLHEFYEPARVLDFVDSKSRKNEKTRLENEPEDGDDRASGVDVVVGVNSLSIGVDWPECAAVVNTVNDHSIINLMQKPGRAFRKFHRKSEIEIYSCVPRPQVKEGMSAREVMSDYTNQILAHFFMQDMFDPIVFTGLDEIIHSPDGVPGRSPGRQRLRDRWRKNSEYAKVLTEVSEKAKEMSLLESASKRTLSDFENEVAAIIAAHDAEFPPGELEATAHAFVSRILATKRYDLTEAKPSGSNGNPAQIAGAINVAFIREDFDFDKVTLADANLFDTQGLSEAELRQMRAIVKTHSWDARFDEAEELFEKSNAKQYILRSWEQGRQLDWVSGGFSSLSEREREIAEWAIRQYKGAEELQETQKRRIKSLFKTDPQIRYKLPDRVVPYSRHRYG
jgi:hypothetical protein